MSITRAELQDAARQAFGNALMPDAAESWGHLTEMGFLGLLVPEAQGGLGLGLEALAALHYELGRALVPGPAIAQMLVIEALSSAGSSAGHTALLTAALAGQKMTVGHFACDADAASHILVGGEGGIHLITPDATTLTLRPTWDETRRLFAPVDFTPGMVIAEGAAAEALAARLKTLLCLMLAADSLGGADALLAMTIDYLKTRKQFDRPLAMFQALKHRCADLKAALVTAEALLWSRATDAEARLIHFGALKARACRVYAMVAEEAIQLHGGIGLTLEHPCHLFLKRAMLNAALGGDGDYWEALVGADALAMNRV